MPVMLRVGLTGGIGAGKSTVAARLAEHGAVVIDADAIAREVVEPGTPGLAELAEAFGREILTPHGELDRQALAAKAFSDEESRKRLNAIVHPKIGARTAELTAAAAPDAILVHDVPLLVENGIGALYHLTIVVDAPVETRVRRLVESRGMAEQDARARIAAQAERALARIRLAAGDKVIGADHIGDTAVPGRSARDVLDLQLVVSTVDDSLTEALSDAGFPPGDGCHVGADPGRPINLYVHTPDN